MCNLTKCTGTWTRHCRAAYTGACLSCAGIGLGHDMGMARAGCTVAALFEGNTAKVQPARAVNMLAMVATVGARMRTAAGQVADALDALSLLGRRLNPGRS